MFEQDVPYSLLLLLTSMNGKSSLLRRGTRWLAYPRVVERLLHRPVFGRWQLSVVTFEKRRRADHHDHGYDDRERAIPYHAR
jgi:hypothetical protein